MDIIYMPEIICIQRYEYDFAIHRSPRESKIEPEYCLFCNLYLRDILVFDRPQLTKD